MISDDSRSELVGPDGRRLATYVYDVTGRDRWAEDIKLAPGVSLEDVVPAIMAEFAGWIAGGPDELCTALVAAGAKPRRHAHVMTLDLVASPPPQTWAASGLPAGLRYSTLGGDPEFLYEAYVGAYRRSDSDVGSAGPREDFDRNLVPLLRGEILGPVLDSSAVIVDGHTGRAAAACILTDRDGLAWIAEIFRDPAPRYAGTGGALLRRCLWRCARDGVQRVGLAVTVGNAAQLLYEEAGFIIESTSRNVFIPAAPPSVA
jgi:ribosomal protein S18 acetylase RimI-like enzyme